MISFFALPSYVGKSYSRHAPESTARRLSSRIRAEEMAAYLGAKLNPVAGFEHDTCIYVKPRNLAEVPDGSWVDFLDSTPGFLGALKQRPKIKVIAASQCSFDVLKENLPNKIVLIPSHHLNQERLKRTRTKITTGGYIGSPSPAAFQMYGEIKTELKKIGLDFVTSFDFKERQDAINLYSQIDLFIIGPWVGDDSPHKIPTKIINAASFGIPSIAYPLKGYQEIEGQYVQAHDINEIIFAAEKFKNKRYYNAWSKKVTKMAENYHISSIAPLYEKLDDLHQSN